MSMKPQNRRIKSRRDNTLHRTQAYNEFSARYSVMPNEHYIPSKERMVASQQSKTNKQGSEDGLDEYVAEVELETLADEQKEIYDGYEARLVKGVSKEIARLNTPVSRYSKMRAKTDVRNWLGFLFLRMENSAMWEIRQYANAVAEIIQYIWPRTFDLFLEHDFFGVRFSRTEMRCLRKMMTLLADKDGFMPPFEGDSKKLQTFVQKLLIDKEALYPHLK